MSVTAMAYVWSLTSDDLSSTDKFVLLALADHADHEGRNIYPSVPTIAQKCSLGERTVQYAIKRLIDAGYLVPDGKHSIKNGATNRYAIPMSAGETGARGAPLKQATGARGAPVPVHVVHPTGARGAPKPSLNRPSTVMGNADAFRAPVSPVPPAPQAPPKHPPSRTGATVDATTDFFNRAVATKTPERVIASWRCGEHVKNLCTMFAQVFSAQVTKSDSGKWIAGATRLAELSPTLAELQAIRAKCSQPLTHPGACYEWVKGLRQVTQSSGTADTPVFEPVCLPNGDVEYRRVTAPASPDGSRETT